jgi:GNAT superfamily N-acetyltransferase
MQLEGKSLIGERLMRDAEAAPDGDLPLMLIAQLSTRELVTYYNKDLPADLQRGLAGCVRAITFPHIEAVTDFLNSHKIQTEAGHYATYVFPTNSTDLLAGDVIICSKQDARVLAFGFNGPVEPVFAIERHGRIVSACASARENEQCGEAWVFTDPEYRNQGLGGKVVSAWANGLIRARKIPFYSHELENTASASLARRLELQPVFEEINIRQVPG